MSPERFERLRLLFDAAMRRLPAEQEALVRAECADDPALQREVLRRIRNHEGDPTAIPTVSGAPPAYTPDDAPDRVVGMRVGPYVIRERIGRGGMGAVYRAERDRPAMTVAIKVVQAHLLSERFRRRFEIEQEALALLVHPGIARLYDAGEADLGQGRQPYFVMELVRGKSLTEHAGGGRTQGSAAPLSIRARLELLASVAVAVQHAHQRGVTHRDLKPGNILVTDEGQPKVLDFGLARVIAATADAEAAAIGGAAAPPRVLVPPHASRPLLSTEGLNVAGTLPYMSPEQSHGNAADLDVRTDVYSLGVVAYELLTGRMPYAIPARIDSPAQLRDALAIIRAAEPSPLSDTREGSSGWARWLTARRSDDRRPPAQRFPRDIEAIIAKTLQKDREQRYASAGPLADDIRRYLNDEPVSARRQTRRYVLAKFARRNRVLVGGVGGSATLS